MPLLTSAYSTCIKHVMRKSCLTVVKQNKLQHCALQAQQQRPPQSHPLCSSLLVCTACNRFIAHLLPVQPSCRRIRAHNPGDSTMHCRSTYCVWATQTMTACIDIMHTLCGGCIAGPHVAACSSLLACCLVVCRPLVVVCCCSLVHLCSSSCMRCCLSLVCLVHLRNRVCNVLLRCLVCGMPCSHLTLHVLHMSGMRSSKLAVGSSSVAAVLVVARCRCCCRCRSGDGWCDGRWRRCSRRRGWGCDSCGGDCRGGGWAAADVDGSAWGSDADGCAG
jgi:hypothetical protein